MNKLFLIFLFLSSLLIAQTRVGDVVLPNTIDVSKSTLVLNGAGIREKYFMDMYVAGLYLKTKSKSEQQILGADEPVLMRLVIVSSLITPDRMIEAIDEGFENSMNGKTTPMKDKIAQFKSAFKSGIKSGDTFDIYYTSTEGIVIKRNQVQLISIPGSDFRKAVFGIWLGAKPVDDDLKKGLLSN